MNKLKIDYECEAEDGRTLHQQITLLGPGAQEVMRGVIDLVEKRSGGAGELDELRTLLVKQKRRKR